VLADLAVDIYLRTNILSDNNMLVAAIDAWRTYFSKYPDDNDLRPLLAESYARLRLDNLRRREVRLYQSQLSEQSTAFLTIGQLLGWEIRAGNLVSLPVGDQVASPSCV
jgi:hypothetical protein